MLTRPDGRKGRGPLAVGVAGAIVGLVAGAWFLGDRFGASRAEPVRSAPAAIASPPAVAAAPPLQPPTPASQDVPRPVFLAPTKPGPVVAEPPAETAAAVAPLAWGDRSTPWERIAPGDPFSALGDSLGPSLVSGLKADASPRFRACVREFRPPPGVSGQFKSSILLDVEAEADVLVVVDAAFEAQELSDADLDRCLLEAYRGRRLPAQGATPGRRHRIRWPVSFGVSQPR